MNAPCLSLPSIRWKLELVLTWLRLTRLTLPLPRVPWTSDVYGLPLTMFVRPAVVLTWSVVRTMWKSLFIDGTARPVMVNLFGRGTVLTLTTTLIYIRFNETIAGEGMLPPCESRFPSEPSTTFFR